MFYHNTAHFDDCSFCHTSSCWMQNDFHATVLSVPTFGLMTTLVVQELRANLYMKNRYLFIVSVIKSHSQVPLVQNVTSAPHTLPEYIPHRIQYLCPFKFPSSQSNQANFQRTQKSSPDTRKYYNIMDVKAKSDGPSDNEKSLYSVVYCTVPSAEKGKEIASALVENKLAACVNTLTGIESTYWWDGKVHCDKELLLIIKTRTELIPQVSESIKQLHPYDVPEIIALPIQAGFPGYLNWIKDSTREP